MMTPKEREFVALLGEAVTLILTGGPGGSSRSRDPRPAPPRRDPDEMMTFSIAELLDARSELRADSGSHDHSKDAIFPPYCRGLTESSNRLLSEILDAVIESVPGGPGAFEIHIGAGPARHYR